MKKFITLLLSLCLALTCTALFVACEKKDPVDPLATAKTEATTYVENGWKDLTDLGIDLSSYAARYEAVKSDITAATTEDEITSAKTTFDALKFEITAANDAAIAAKELADTKTAAIASVEASWKALKDVGITLTSYETQYTQIKTAINAAETKEKVAEYKASFDTLAQGIKAEHDAAVAFQTAKSQAIENAENVWNSLSAQDIDLTSYTERYNAIKSDLSAAATQEQLTASKASFDALLAEIEEKNAAAVALANAKTKLLTDISAAWDELVENDVVLTPYVNDYEAIKANITAATAQDQLGGYKTSFDTLIAKINADQTPDTFVFEAEAASFDVVNGNWGIRTGGYEPNCGIYSGTGYLGNWQSTENAIIFSIESDRAAKAVVGMRVGFRYDDMLIFGSDAACFSGVLVNDNPIDLPENAYFEKVTADDGPNYFAWGNRELFTIDLVKGTNTIRFDLAGKNINWDYLYLTTVAELSWTSEKENGHNYSDWVVTKMPTAEEEGRMFRQCDVCCEKEVVILPVLSDAYTVQATRQATETLSELTTYTVDGRSFVVETAPALGDVVAIKIEAESGYSSSWSGNAALKTESNGGKTFVALNNRKGTLSYTFNSAANGTATLVLNMAPHQNGNCYANAAFKLQVNGKTVAIDDTLLVEKAGSGWFNTKDFTVAVFEVKEGENTLVIETTGQGNCYNLDYLLIKSAAFEEELVSLTVKTQPTKLYYVVGESFDATGMVVEALYSSGRTEVVTDYTVDKTVLSVDDTEVTVSCGDLSVTVAVTVTEVTLTEYAFNYTDVVATNTGSQNVKVEGTTNYGNIAGNTFTITVNCAKATTVEFIYYGARPSANYTKKNIFSTFSVNEKNYIDNIPDDSISDVLKGWGTPVDIHICNIDLQEGNNVITFKMAQNINLWGLKFLSSEEITVVSTTTAE